MKRFFFFTAAENEVWAEEEEEDGERVEEGGQFDDAFSPNMLITTYTLLHVFTNKIRRQSDS